MAFDWGDVDLAGERLRVRGSKTTAGLRFVPLLPWVHDVFERRAPAVEDRVGPVFPGLSDDGARSAMARACKFAGVRHFTPHDLRHRYITCPSLARVPLPLIRQIAGHTKNTVTLDIYTGIILAEPAERLDELRRAVGRMTGLDGGARGAVVGPRATLARSKS